VLRRRGKRHEQQHLGSLGHPGGTGPFGAPSCVVLTGTDRPQLWRIPPERRNTTPPTPKSRRQFPE
jgi:hypothetical protein